MLNPIVGNFRTFQNYRRWEKGGGDDVYALLSKKYFDSVVEEMIIQLKSVKNLSYDEAKEFIEHMLSLKNQRYEELRNDFDNSYLKGKTIKDCAEFMIKKYYNLTKINTYDNIVGHEEITGVTEGVNSVFYHYKNVSISLFWNFINRINNLDGKFKFDISIINDNDNSLNNRYFLFYVESNDINKKDVENEFFNSKLLSNIITFLESESENIKFYIGVDFNNKLRFGYIIDDKRYTIGDVEYTSIDIKKLTNYITIVNQDINFYELARKFKTAIYVLDHYKKVFKLYLKSYIDLEVYTSVIDNKLVLIIDTDDSDIINKTYIYSIINDNKVKNFDTSDLELNDKIIRGNLFYYISLK